MYLSIITVLYEKEMRQFFRCSIDPFSFCDVSAMAMKLLRNSSVIGAIPALITKVEGKEEKTVVRYV